LTGKPYKKSNPFSNNPEEEEILSQPATPKINDYDQMCILVASIEGCDDFKVLKETQEYKHLIKLKELTE
jgi:hypothetical protein